MNRTDEMYSRFVDALRDEGIEAEYDPRQSIVTLERYTGFFRDLYKDRGEVLVTFIASDTEIPREPSPPGSGLLSGRNIKELAAEAANYIKNMNERLEPLRSRIREIVKENLDFRSGRVRSPNFSANGYIQRFLRKTLSHFAKELDSAYDIEFQDAVETNLSVQTDFELYNSRQDIFQEGRILIYEHDGNIHIEARGGLVGEPGDTFLDVKISYSDDPSSEVDIVSSFRTLI